MNEGGLPPRSAGSHKVKESYSYASRRFILPTQKFIHTESLTGIVLLLAAVVAMIWANSPFKELYFHFWHTPITIDFNYFVLSEDRQHIVNDVFMTIFFFVVGLEIKRELIHGELSSVRKAALPIVAALGGMIVPALIYLFFNAGTPAEKGWGIPMATDIAFSLGILALLGRRIPIEAKIFLLALAIADDVGAIVIIALFYAGEISFAALGVAAVLFGVIYLMKRIQVSDFLPYIILGTLFWLAVQQSGIHATIAGVMLGIMTPARAYLDLSKFETTMAGLLKTYLEAVAGNDRNRIQSTLGEMEEVTRHTESPLDRLVRTLHPWSNFLVLPLFALANSGIEISADVMIHALQSPVALGVMCGLLLGKFLGILGFTWVPVKMGWLDFPKSMGWIHLVGLAILAGIGFTVSIFITGLAFSEPRFALEAKIGIIIGSLIAGIAGYLVLRMASKQPKRV